MLRKSVKNIIQETLEQEVSDYLGRDYFERNPQAKTGYRNGYGNPYYGGRTAAIRAYDNPYTRFANYNPNAIGRAIPGYQYNGNPYYGGIGPVPLPGQGGYYPPGRDGGYPGHGEGLGDKVVHFLNNVTASVNNARMAVADWIAPKSPFVTRYVETNSYYGKEYQQHEEAPQGEEVAWVANQNFSEPAPPHTDQDGG